MFLEIEILDMNVWTLKKIQIETFSRQGHDPIIFKSINSRFGGKKSLNSKLILWSCSRMLKVSI